MTEEKISEKMLETDKKQIKAQKRKKRRRRAKRFFIGFVVTVLAVILITAAVNVVVYKSLVNKVKNFDTVECEKLNYEYYDNGCMNIYTDRGLKVVQITDVHIGAGWMSVGKDTMAVNAVSAMLTAEKPDLVIVTGDVAYPVPFQAGTLNNKTAVTVFAEMMEKMGVYWVYCFGNHDTEIYSYCSREQIVNYLDSEKYPHCLLQKGPEDVDGYGNQVINIVNSDGVITRTIITLDSHTYPKGELTSIFGRYDNLHQNQVDWYGKTVDEANAKNKAAISSLDKKTQEKYKGYETVPTSLFFHIPLTEYKDAWDEYVANSFKDGGNVECKYGTVGEEGDAICCGMNEDNMFEKILEKKSTDTVFCGHDHLNTFSIKYKGVYLTYGMSIDYLAYYGIYKLGSQRGCTVINIDENGAIDYTPESYYQDKYVSYFEKETVEMQKLGNH